jgi:hypothetical protein
LYRLSFHLSQIFFYYDADRAYLPLLSATKISLKRKRKS